MGRRLAKREETEVERRPSKRPERFTRDVRTSMGMFEARHDGFGGRVLRAVRKKEGLLLFLDVCGGSHS